MTDYNKMVMDNLNALMREIAEYTRMAEEIGAMLDSLKDTLKKHMEENGLDSIAGSEHKASYKAVTSSRIDTTALKRDLPEIAAKYTKTTETRRFFIRVKGVCIMIYYHVVSCVNNDGTVFQTYRNKRNAIKTALKRFESGCYKRVFVWVENTERKPGNAQILEDLRRV